MKRTDLVELYYALQKAETLKGKCENRIKYNYNVARNVERIEREVKIIDKITEAKDDFKVYDKERLELCKKHAKKDEKGEPVIQGQNFDLNGEDGKLKPEFMAEMEELQIKHKVALDTYNEQIQERARFMEEESDIELFRLTSTNIPDDATAQLVRQLLPIIDEN